MYNAVLDITTKHNSKNCARKLNDNLRLPLVTQKKYQHMSIHICKQLLLTVQLIL